MNRSRKRPKRDKSLPSFAKLITWLDGYAALSCVDPSKIEKLMKNNSDADDLQNSWKEAKDDVTEIANLPSSSKGILRLAKILNITKSVFLFLGIGLVLVWFILERIGVLFTTARTSALILIIAIIVFYNVNIFAYAFLSRRLNARISEYYHNHGKEVRKQRIHLRAVTQGLIDKLTTRVRRAQFDPYDYSFTLFHSDYSNIKIVKEDERRGTYSAIVEARSAKQHQQQQKSKN